MNRKQAAALYKKYLAGEATAEERALLESAQYNWVKNQQLPAYDQDTVRASIKAKIARSRSGRRSTRLWPYAAAVALALSIASYFLIFQSSGDFREIAASEVAPGTNRATLMLADGRTIDLSEAQSGIIVGEEINYIDGSEVVDAGKESLVSDVSRLMSLSTPKGGTYQVTLPDGSKVWLNAGSTLKYPSRFSGEERVVELEGEAYFDIETVSLKSEVSGLMARLPFKVVSRGQAVEVLGTEFNIAAYPDEDVTTTTLVEGSVRLRGATGASVSLVPGEQGQLLDETFQVNEVDLASVTAWKNGYFEFAGNLESVLAQVSRWYDVGVVFKDASLKNERIFGIVFRDKALDEVLDIISLASDAKFVVSTNGTERRIEVMR